MPWGLVFINGSERSLLSHPYSPSFQNCLWPLHKCVDVALSPLRQIGIRIMNYILFRGNVAPGEWRLLPQMVQMIWPVFGEAEVDLFHCPIYFQRKQARCPGPGLAHHSFVYLPLRFPASSGHQTCQGSQMLSPPGDPTQEESDVVPRVDSGTTGRPLADTIEDRPPLTTKRHDLASPARAVEPACLASLGCFGARV